MKFLRRSWTIFAFLFGITTLLLGIYLKQQNNILSLSNAQFTEAIKQEQHLIDQNAALKKRWGHAKNFLADLSEYLVLPQHEISNNPISVYSPEVQHEIPVYENYLSGFIAYDNCVKILEKLCEAQLPISITSLSIHRNIAHNYALQLSMTYRTE